MKVMSAVQQCYLFNIINQLKAREQASYSLKNYAKPNEDKEKFYKTNKATGNC